MTLDAMTRNMLLTGDEAFTPKTRSAGIHQTFGFVRYTETYS